MLWRKTAQREYADLRAIWGTVKTRLREIGFAEGDLVEILHIGAFGRSPLNVKLHGTSIAMRPNEAKMIRVIPADLHREKLEGLDRGNRN